MSDVAAGRQVRLHREARGMSQADLARRIRQAGRPLHQQTIAKIENGTRPIRLSEAVAMAEIFRMPLASLTGVHASPLPRVFVQVEHQHVVVCGACQSVGRYLDVDEANVAREEHLISHIEGGPDGSTP